MINLDEIKAVVFGHAIGDALGFPVEFFTRQELEENPVVDMVKNEKLDAVVITTPDFYHEEGAVEALEAGVNVLIF